MSKTQNDALTGQHVDRGSNPVGAGKPLEDLLLPTKTVVAEPLEVFRPPSEVPRLPRWAASLNVDSPAQQAIAAWMEEQRCSMISEYRLRLIDKSIVEFDLSGSSPIAFLERMQDAFPAHLGSELVRDLKKDRANHLVLPVGSPLFRVNGSVEGSQNKTRAENNIEGLNNVSMAILAVAHASAWLLNYGDLFDGKITRCIDGALTFGDGPLAQDLVGDMDRYRDMKNIKIVASKLERTVRTE